MTLDELERLLADHVEATIALAAALTPESRRALEKTNAILREAPRLLALARAGERLFGAGKDLEVAATTNNLEDIPGCVVALDAALAAWEEAWDGT